MAAKSTQFVGISREKTIIPRESNGRTLGCKKGERLKNKFICPGEIKPRMSGGQRIKKG